MAAKNVCSILRCALLHHTRPRCPFHRYLSSNVVTDKVSFTPRTHTCGELRVADVGKDVTLCGWLQYRRMRLFFILRDWHGITQTVVPEEQMEKLDGKLSALTYDSVLRVEGTVQRRPDGETNKRMDTGEIEVLVKDVQILNSCKANLPLGAKDFHQVSEALSMKYRYLDIRRPAMQRNLRLRSAMIMKMREFLCNQHGFVDVETPTLFRRTPGGAQEFIVPSRFPGKFYSLPQSPQQFKQLLMVGGIDRYFQIAKCYRDEGAKPDRQPEFTQVDIEMSFTDQASVMGLIEDLLQNSWPRAGQVNAPFPRMSYLQARHKFGTDKPDTRFAMELCDITDTMHSCDVPAITDRLQSPTASVHAICVPQARKHLSNKDVDSVMKLCQDGLPQLNVMTVKIKEVNTWQGGVAKSLTEGVKQSISDRLVVQPNDIVVMVTGETDNVLTCLGRARLACADALEARGVPVRSSAGFHFLWVEDFPLFLPREDGEEGVESAHHPFTAPHKEDEHLLYTHPEKVRSQHYDLVLNGAEVGGGSIRIHNSRMQRYVLETILKEDAGQLEHLLDALDSGCPPHGGIALGLDRLLAIICGTNSIRDVIAFPKSHDGKDPMSQSPAEVSQADLDRYSISVKT
ncbi:aspartate--tRNA ligase, mitochondrial-like [Haliotis cracherodii]|uniref:aspartate--tRNA ligase, mitochondrial-like n=1 Tax=Haliotis cracherodii TaxID=6455 RepID=UPI0039EB0DED